jgi:hypothetical protein
LKIKIYSFVRKIDEDRFDYHYIRNVIKTLESKSHQVEWENLDGDDKYVYKNDCEVTIDQGSITIFEFEDKTFKTFDFGDMPSLSIKLSKSKNFRGACIGQYNKKLWDETIKDSSIRSNIQSVMYPESYWEFGTENYDQIKEYRECIDLSPNLYWRGTIYQNTGIPNYDGCRNSIPLIKLHLKDKFSLNVNKLGFDKYIKESCQHRLVLGFGGGGGYTCGDFCLRDIEMFGIGIPVLRPKFNIETKDPLIPNKHYISVNIDDCLDDKFRIKSEWEYEVAHRISQTYLNSIENINLLNYISQNAKKWYDDNIKFPNNINNIITSLNL